LDPRTVNGERRTANAYLLEPKKTEYENEDEDENDW
jgi:hypothetical protein